MERVSSPGSINAPVTADTPIRIGVSSCLLGERVRYDGGHKRDPFLTGVMGPHVEWVAVCPEFEMGLGAPREPLQLERKNGKIHLVSIETGVDHTKTMERWAKRRLGELDGENLSGYILKSRSPSCGMERVQTREDSGARAGRERGLYAKALIGRFENLPIEEERRLANPNSRENFIECVFAYRRLRQLFGKRWRNRDVVEFQARHKLLLMAHSPRLYRETGRLVAEMADMAERSRQEFRAQYESLFMQAMKARTTRGRHAKVLQHMAGCLTECAGFARREELSRLIEDYSRGLAPLSTPLAVIRRLVRRFGVDYLDNQFYLNPHPKEIVLRDSATFLS